jgi:hypothetical protein
MWARGSKRSAPTSGSPGPRRSATERQESARAARDMRMQHRRVASWPSGLDGLSLAAHAPIPCQSVPGRRRVRSANSVMLPVPDTGPHLPNGPHSREEVLTRRAS